MTKNHTKLNIFLFFSFFLSYHNFTSQASIKQAFQYEEMFPRIHTVYQEEDNTYKRRLEDNLRLEKDELFKKIAQLTPGVERGDKTIVCSARALIKALQKNHRRALLDLIPCDFLKYLLQKGYPIDFYGLKTIATDLLSRDCRSFFRVDANEIIQNGYGFNLKLLKAMSMLDESKSIRAKEISFTRYLRFCIYYLNPTPVQSEPLVRGFSRGLGIDVPTDIQQMICHFMRNESIEELIREKDPATYINKFSTFDKSCKFLILPSLLADQPELMKLIAPGKLRKLYKKAILYEYKNAVLYELQKIRHKNKNEKEMHEKRKMVYGKLLKAITKFFLLGLDKSELLKKIKQLTPDIKKEEERALLEAEMLLRALQSEDRYAMLDLIPYDFLRHLLQKGYRIDFYGLERRKCALFPIERQAFKKVDIEEINQNRYAFNLKLIKAMSTLDESRVVKIHQLRLKINFACFLYFSIYYLNPIHVQSEPLVSGFLRISEMNVGKDIQQMICSFIQNEDIDESIYKGLSEYPNTYLKNFDFFDEKYNLPLVFSLLTSHPEWMKEIEIEMLGYLYDKAVSYNSRIMHTNAFKQGKHKKREEVLHKFLQVFDAFLQSNEERKKAWQSYQKEKSLLNEQKENIARLKGDTFNPFNQERPMDELQAVMILGVWVFSICLYVFCNLLDKNTNC